MVKVSIDEYADELVPELLQFDKIFHSYDTPKINPLIVLEFDVGLYVVHAPSDGLEISQFYKLGVSQDYFSNLFFGSPLKYYRIPIDMQLELGVMSKFILYCHLKGLSYF